MTEYYRTTLSDRGMSARYRDLAGNKGSGTPYDDLVPVPDARIAALRQEYRGLPADFADFLTEIGAGSLAGDRYQLYDGLVGPDDIYGVVEDGFDTLALFGDDLQGLGDGFDTQDWRVVEVDPTNATFHTVGASFEDFIRAKIAELA